MCQKIFLYCELLYIYIISYIFIIVSLWGFNATPPPIFFHKLFRDVTLCLNALCPKLSKLPFYKWDSHAGGNLLKAISEDLMIETSIKYCLWMGLNLPSQSCTVSGSQGKSFLLWLFWCDCLKLGLSLIHFRLRYRVTLPQSNGQAPDLETVS